MPGRKKEKGELNGRKGKVLKEMREQKERKGRQRNETKKGDRMERHLEKEEESMEHGTKVLGLLTRNEKLFLTPGLNGENGSTVRLLNW